MISHATLMSHHLPNPVRVLALYESDPEVGMELCRDTWPETLPTPDAVLKAVQRGRAIAIAAKTRKSKPHHKKRSPEVEAAIVQSLATAECVADIAREYGVSDQLVLTIARERGIAWPVLSKEARSARIKAVHAAAKEAVAAPVKRKPVQLDLIDWLDAQKGKRVRRTSR